MMKSLVRASLELRSTEAKPCRKRQHKLQYTDRIFGASTENVKYALQLSSLVLSFSDQAQACNAGSCNWRAQWLETQDGGQ